MASFPQHAILLFAFPRARSRASAYEAASLDTAAPRYTTPLSRIADGGTANRPRCLLGTPKRGLCTHVLHGFVNLQASKGVIFVNLQTWLKNALQTVFTQCRRNRPSIKADGRHAPLLRSCEQKRPRGRTMRTPARRCAGARGAFAAKRASFRPNSGRKGADPEPGAARAPALEAVFAHNLFPSAERAALPREGGPVGRTASAARRSSSDEPRRWAIVP